MVHITNITLTKILAEKKAHSYKTDGSNRPRKNIILNKVQNEPFKVYLILGKGTSIRSDPKKVSYHLKSVTPILLDDINMFNSYLDISILHTKAL